MTPIPTSNLIPKIPSSHCPYQLRIPNSNPLLYHIISSFLKSTIISPSPKDFSQFRRHCFGDLSCLRMGPRHLLFLLCRGGLNLLLRGDRRHRLCLLLRCRSCGGRLAKMRMMGGRRRGRLDGGREGKNVS